MMWGHCLSSGSFECPGERVGPKKYSGEGISHAFIFFNLLGEGKWIETTVLRKTEATANSSVWSLLMPCQTGYPHDFEFQPANHWQCDFVAYWSACSVEFIHGRLYDYMRSMVSTYDLPLVSQKLVCYKSSLFPFHLFFLMKTNHKVVLSHDFSF